MSEHRISIIAAIGQNRELGKNNELIWRISDDLKRVKELTMSHPIIMGRKTYESIGRPLPGRTNIIITRDQTYQAEGCKVVDSLDSALAAAKDAPGNDEIFIFGGASIYEAALPQTDRLYLTLIDDLDLEADTFFPKYEQTFEKNISQEDKSQDGLKYKWLTLERNTEKPAE